MELSDFIQSTFTEIINGVKGARATGAGGSGIGSVMRYKVDNLGSGLMQDASGALHSVVEFDVAVTASTKRDGTVGVNVLAAKLSGGALKEDQTVSRVKFSIPVNLSL